MKPRKSKKKEKKEKRKKYNPDNIKKALQAIAGGMSRKLAAKTFQVPRTTLIYRLQNPEHNSRPGPATILTEKEEDNLEDWIKTCSKKGFPKRKDDVINSVSQFLKNQDRGSRFKNGEKWFKLFLQRHPDISIRTPEAVTAASAAVSENDVRGWFKQIEEYLRENDFLHILSDPSRVYNGDETNFMLCPKTGVVLAAKGSKNVYEVDSAPAKTSLTVMFTFGANGDTTPPMVIFPNKRLSADITSKIPPDWGIGLSENGWMKSEIFHDYIESVLYPYLTRNGIQFPIILFVDGHKTHLTYAVSELCTNLNIVLIALYPNCTRILQPADVAAFKPLKYGWQKSVLDWRRSHPSEALTKSNFVPLLQKTIEKWVSPSTVMNGFRATGLYPWNLNAIDFSKCLGKVSAPEVKCNKRQNIALTREKFISIVGEKKLQEIERDTARSEDNYYLRQIWDFFKDGQLISTVNTHFQEVTKERQQGQRTLPTITRPETPKNSKPVPTIYLNITEDNNLRLPGDDVAQYPESFSKTDIANMEVIIDNDKQYPEAGLSSHEVLVEFVQEEQLASEVDGTCSQDIQSETVSHTVQVHDQPSNKKQTATNVKEIIVNKVPPHQDYDKITEDNNLRLPGDDVAQYPESFSKTDIANMEVIIDNDKQYPEAGLSSHEVLVEFVQEEQLASEVDGTCSQDIQSETVSHTVQVHDQPSNKKQTATNVKEIIVNKVPPHQDYDKIELLEDEINPSLSLSATVLSQLTPVKLQDVLSIPKTPQRKGNRNTKRAPFVLTSVQWKMQEDEKKRIKEEKVESIKKRKEERLKKKQIKTEETKKKKTKPQPKKTSAKKTLVSDNLCVLDITLKPDKNNVVSEENKEDMDIDIGRESSSKGKVYTTEEIERFLTEFED